MNLFDPILSDLIPRTLHRPVYVADEKVERRQNSERVPPPTGERNG
jgi:hypothetical protein